MENKSKEEPKIKVSYPQDWIAYNQAQTQEKILFLELLYEITSQIPQPRYKGNGRPPANLGEMVFSCCLKTYLDFSSRRSESDLKLAQHLGYINQSPHFNTILKYLNKTVMKKVLMKLIEASSLPLKEVEEDFTMDASGFSTIMYGHWLKKRSIYNEHRTFKKAHVMSGVKTNVITHIEVTDGYVSDKVMLEKLICSTSRNFRMREVSADKGYLSEKNLWIIFKNGAFPFIPFIKSVRGTSDNRLPIWNIMYRFFRDHKDEFMEHYHKRSNAESVFSMMKRKFGDYVRARNSIAQENEVLCKALCHNLVVLIHEIFELGIKVDFSDVPQEFMCKIEV
ncbi:MAG: transposase [Thermoplasmatales archaeon]|nr:MAG: transposase [Thermoplasmatales archaeon]